MADRDKWVPKFCGRCGKPLRDKDGSLPQVWYEGTTHAYCGVIGQSVMVIPAEAVRLARLRGRPVRLIIDPRELRPPPGRVDTTYAMHAMMGRDTTPGLEIMDVSASHA